MDVYFFSPETVLSQEQWLLGILLKNFPVIRKAYKRFCSYFILVVCIT